jgi:hypothetical protein
VAQVREDGSGRDVGKQVCYQCVTQWLR